MLPLNVHVNVLIVKTLAFDLRKIWTLVHNVLAAVFVDAHLGYEILLVIVYQGLQHLLLKLPRLSFLIVYHVVPLGILTTGRLTIGLVLFIFNRLGKQRNLGLL